MLWLGYLVAAVGWVQAQTATETLLHTFGNFPQGANPYGTLIRDASGNLYGTTSQGGPGNAGNVFELTATVQYKILYSFKGGADGANPYSAVVMDSARNLYGTTYQGGASGKGTVYKLDTSGRETVLYSFTGGADGSGPYAGVVLDGVGNLYGTTYYGGGVNAGVVYKLSPSGQETVLYSFKGGSDGANPYSGVVLDPAGNLYGTTRGNPSPGTCVVYKLDPSGHETVMHNFGAGGSTAAGAPVILDSSNNLYGTSGNVYKLSPSGQYTQLAFLNPTIFGDGPSASLAMDAAGNLYGTTNAITGGTSQSYSRYGAVFKLDTAEKLTLLYRFPGPPKAGVSVALGLNPGIVLDSAGNMYGSTPYGGYGGIVYQLDATGKETTLQSFTAAPGGSRAYGGVIRDAEGNLYGTTGGGGRWNRGVVYKLDVAGHETVLDNSAEGFGEYVARDSAGNLYVTGTSANTGLGAIYRVAPSGQSTVLYNFTGGADGTGSNGVTLDSAGNLYGASAGGMAPSGLVFKLDTADQFSILYTFTGGADGSDPNAGLVLDAAGNIYGTTVFGGMGYGVVYKLDPTGHETVLHSFSGYVGSDGGTPFSGVTRDSSGNLYGTTPNYGSGHAGVVYKLDTNDIYTVLYSFAGGPGGGGPWGGVAIDGAGNLYGATNGGGGTGCGNTGCGVVYKIDTSDQETVLYTFTGGADGSQPEAGVILDSGGTLYGTTPFGGAAGAGVVYKLTLQ